MCTEALTGCHQLFNRDLIPCWVSLQLPPINMLCCCPKVTSQPQGLQPTNLLCKDLTLHLTSLLAAEIVACLGLVVLSRCAQPCHLPGDVVATALSICLPPWAWSSCSALSCIRASCSTTAPNLPINLIYASVQASKDQCWKEPTSSALVLGDLAVLHVPS